MENKLSLVDKACAVHPAHAEGGRLASCSRISGLSGWLEIFKKLHLGQ